MIKNCPNNYCFKIKFLLCTNVKNWLKLTVIKWHGQCTKIETFQGKLFFQIILSVLWPQVEKCNSFLYNFANFFPSSSLSHSNLRSQRSHSFSMLSCILCVWNNNACLQIVTSLNCIWQQIKQFVYTKENDNLIDTFCTSIFLHCIFTRNGISFQIF